MANGSEFADERKAFAEKRVEGLQFVSLGQAPKGRVRPKVKAVGGVQRSRPQAGAG